MPVGFGIRERTSHAAVVDLPAPSRYSKSLTFTQYNLTKFRDLLKEAGNLVSPYNLSNFISDGAELKDWMTSNVMGRVRYLGIFIHQERSLQLPDPWPLPLETSKTISL